MPTSLEDRRKLLAFCRAVSRRTLGIPEPSMDRPVLEQPGDGAFVTFYRGRRLRGCMGTLAAVGNLADTIEHVTKLALADPRFASAPITAGELGKLTVEISLLTVPTPTDDPLGLDPGRHGVVVRRGARSGCFLPKVASDRGWSAEEFLRQCCESKAGFAADAWCDPDTEVLLFEAESFRDEAK